MGVRYNFQPYELEACHVLAEARNTIKVQRRVASKKFDPRKTDLRIHIQAVKAEFAVAEIVGGRVSDDVTVHGNQDGNVILPDNRRGMVKYRTKRGWDFALSTDDMASFYGDLGFLVWPVTEESDDGDVEVVGWITRKEFAEMATIVTYNQGPRLSLSPWRLHSVESLLS